MSPRAMMTPVPGSRLLLVSIVGLLVPAALGAQAAPGAAAYESMTGAELYEAACASCHGADGTGAARSRVAFEEPLPDFSDCAFATREPDTDWIAVTHEGGPARGFSRMMPAFGDALDVEAIGRAMDHVRTLCGHGAWPRGELNLPRPMVTEKAYPEDEAVLTTGTALDGPGSISNELTYEKRFGPRSQIELVVPFAFRERSLEEGSEDWVGGLGDVALGVKHAVFHDLGSGSILSVAAEVKLPTGDEHDGLGAGTTIFEPFVAYGQILPADGFLHVQGLVELPADPDVAEEEAALRVALGRTFTEGRWGRAWSPMVEVLASRELASGATTHWDLVPQLQVTLNTRQHVMANLAVRVPVNDTETRDPQLLVYLLWDWFDGGFFEGW